MSIGAIASSIRLLQAQPKSPSGQKPDGSPASPDAPQAAPDVAGTGPADPFRQLSSDEQAKLVQLQATGSDGAQVSSAMGKGMKPHHHLHGTDPDASGSVAPGGAPSGTTTAGAAPASAGNATNAALIESIKKAMQAYSASLAQAAGSTPLATA